MDVYSVTRQYPEHYVYTDKVKLKVKEKEDRGEPDTLEVLRN